MVDETGFDWDYSSIEDNLEAQKLLAAAISSNTKLRGTAGDENEKRKIEELEDTVQRSPTKAMRKCFCILSSRVQYTKVWQVVRDCKPLLHNGSSRLPAASGTGSLYLES